MTNMVYVKQSMTINGMTGSIAELSVPLVYGELFSAQDKELTEFGAVWVCELNAHEQRVWTFNSGDTRTVITETTPIDHIESE